jgi:hypothetical protein
MIVVEDVREENIEDVFRVCSHARLNDPLQNKGMEIKRAWLLMMLREHGPCTKIAYIDGRPVAQILFYPEEAVPFVPDPREDAIVLNCVYNPFPEARGKGAASAAVKSLIEDGRKGIPCLGGRPCSFIAAKPFNTGEGMSLEAFYEMNGFGRAPEEMFMEVAGKYQPRKAMEYHLLPEDRGRSVMFYDTICEWGYTFAIRVRDLLHEIDPGLPVEFINPWQRPEESVKRGNQMLIVNTKVIKSFWTNREGFRREVEEAIRSG